MGYGMRYMYICSRSGNRGTQTRNRNIDRTARTNTLVLGVDVKHYKLNGSPAIR